MWVVRCGVVGDGGCDGGVGNGGGVLECRGGGSLSGSLGGWVMDGRGDGCEGFRGTQCGLCLAIFAAFLNGAEPGVEWSEED